MARGITVDILIFILLMLAVGAGVGILSAALGIGGGVLMVPAFILLLPEMDMNTAKGSSLLAIVFVASYNSWRMNRDDMKTPWDVIGAIAGGSIVGGYFGAWVTSLLTDAAATLVFVGLLFFAAFRTFFVKQHTVGEDQIRRRQAVSMVIGLASGIVAGATGTGGGAILVPLVLWAGIVSNERVVAMSNTVMAASAFAAMLAHLFARQTVDLDWTYGLVDISLAPLVFVGAVAAAPLGRRINSHLSFERRRVVMGVLLFVIAARLLYRVIV